MAMCKASTVAVSGIGPLSTSARASETQSTFTCTNEISESSCNLVFASAASPALDSWMTSCELKMPRIHRRLKLKSAWLEQITILKRPSQPHRLHLLCKRFYIGERFDRRPLRPSTASTRRPTRHRHTLKEM